MQIDSESNFGNGAEQNENWSIKRKGILYEETSIIHKTICKFR